MNDCEGGGEVFQISHEEAAHKAAPTQESQETSHLKSSEKESMRSHFFGSPTYLTVSSQLHLEVFTSSFSRVYTLQPAFRAERSHTSRHLSEFWMLEAEMSFLDDLDHVMDVVEASIKHVFNDGTVKTCLSIPSLSSSKEQGRIPEQVSLLERLKAGKWKRITYTQAVEAIQQAFGDKEGTGGIQWGQPISTEQERWIADEVGNGLPIFVTNYPAELKPFYMRPNELGSVAGSDSTDGRKTVACFDLLVPRIGELAGGSLREERLGDLTAAYEKHGLDPNQYTWYTDLRRYSPLFIYYQLDLFDRSDRFGTTPHGGFGLGFERFISWIGGWENVRECIAAPRWKGRCIL